MDPLTLHRLAAACQRWHVPVVPRLVQRLILVLFHCYLPTPLKLGEGTTLAYGGLGTMIHEDCKIGRNVVIAQHVTLGGRARRKGVPTIEDGCFLGVGSRILGPVRVGAGSIVGANAVVVEDVPPHSVVAGVPARVIRTHVDLADYRTDVARARPAALKEGTGR